MGARCFAEQSSISAEKALSLDIAENRCIFSNTGKFKEIPCEEIPSNFFELKESGIHVEIRGSFAVLTDDKCILVPKGSILRAFSVEYGMVRIIVSEGYYIKKWEEVAESISRKGVYRRIRSPIEGLLVLVHQDPLSKTDRYVLYIDADNQVKVLERNE